MKNIETVLANDACTGCGCCSNICPKQCIETKLDYRTGYYKTSLDASNCVDCGLCRKVCPVYTWNNTEGNPYVGIYGKVYSGYSINEAHRMSSASGGVTTSILAYLLKHKMVDAVVVAVRKEKNPLESELRIVLTEEEVYQSKGSVYAPTSYAEAIAEIMTSEYTRFAVVGLPCHIEGLTHLCEVDRKLKGKIVFKIALVCGHTPSNRAYQYSLQHLGIKPEEVKVLRNRGDGWPGYMNIQYAKNKVVSVGHGSRYSWGQTLGSPLFTPPGCKHCSDATGYLADISVCDAWLPQYASDKKGRNLLLVRSEKMQDVLDAMKKDNVLALKEECIEGFIEANKSVFKEKIYINSIRNARLQKKEGMYPQVNYLHIKDMKAACLTRLLLLSEKIFAKFPQNDCLLFVLKAIKYLSQKWITVKKY